MQGQDGPGRHGRSCGTDDHRGVPDILKVDAEGFEQEVVKGSQSLLGKTEVIFLEWHFFGQPHEPTEPANLIAFMAERGYVLYDFSWFGRRDSDAALQLCEAAFVRRTAICGRSGRDGNSPISARSARRVASQPQSCGLNEKRSVWRLVLCSRQLHAKRLRHRLVGDAPRADVDGRRQR